MTAPLFVVPSGVLAVSGRLVLDGPEGRHAARVRRLQQGERVDLADGTGTLARSVVVRVGRDELEVEVLDVRTEPTPQPRTVVAQALPKGDRGERAVETMTEVGVDVIVPWAAAHCVTRWSGDRAVRGVERWRATAREAAKQARRSWIPDVVGLGTANDVAALLSGATVGLVLHADDAEPIGEIGMPAEGDVVLVVGPEGGLTADELALFSAAGARRVRLGPSVVRASTAGTAALAVLLSRTERWSAPPARVD